MLSALVPESDNVNREAREKVFPLAVMMVRKVVKTQMS